MQYINSNNDWDPLEKIIVGSIGGNPQVPPDEPSYRIKSNGESIIYGYSGPRSLNDIEKANIQLDNFVKILEDEGVEVFRPRLIDFSKPVMTPDFVSKHQNCCYCPRDTMLVLENELLETTMSWRSRYFEYYCYRPLLNSFFEKDYKMKWNNMPKPTMSDNMYRLDYPYIRTDPVRKSFVKAQLYNVINEPVADAADICRIGKDLFIQNAYLTNTLGIEWFKRNYGDKYNIHQLNFENNVFKTHLDALICPLKPGYILYNNEVPIQDKSIIDLFKDNDWNLIEAPKAYSLTMPEGSTSISSLNMNMLSINEDTIIVEESEINMIKFLEDEMGMNVIKVPFRDCYKFGGSFHCCTCDILRKGNLQSYFN